MIKAKHVQWHVALPALSENARDDVVQDTILAHGEAKVQILQQQGRQLRKWWNGRVPAGGIDGPLRSCGPVDASPFLPFACLRGFKRGEESRRPLVPRPLARIVVTFSQR